MGASSSSSSAASPAMATGGVRYVSSDAKKSNALREGSERLSALVRAGFQAAQECDAASGLLNPERERVLCTMMDALRPEHLALQVPCNGSAQTADATPIRTQIVWSCPECELVVFIFPCGASIPLHNHPHMTVLSKVLYGTLAMRAYDWDVPPSAAELGAFTAELARQESPNAAERSGAPLALPRPARLRADTVLTPEAPTYCLRHNFSNLHAFEARTACAVLDLLVPPYDDDGRDCHYFAVRPPPAGEEAATASGAALLEPKAAPASLVIKGQPYGGPYVHPPEERPTEIA